MIPQGNIVGAAKSSVSYLNIINVPADSLLGNPTGSTANASAITLGAGLAFSGSTLVATGAEITITSPNSTINVGGTASAPTIDVNLAHANSWTATQTFDGTHTVTGLPTPSSGSDAANKTYVDNTAAGLNPAVAVSAATTAAGDTSAWTYANGASGIGATFTGPVNTAITIDGILFNTITTQSLLIKNDTQSPSGAFNGIYTFTAAQTVGTGAIFTRRLDYDTPSDINNTGAIPVVGGTANATTSWLLTSNVTTVGTSPLTYAQFSYAPSSILKNTLTNTHLFVGNSSNVATDVAASGDVTLANTGAFTITNNAVTNAKAAQMPANTIKGNNTGGTANAADLTVPQVRAMIPGVAGYAPFDLSTATGATTVVTGLGFQPRLVHIRGGINGTKTFFDGVSDGTNDRGLGIDGSGISTSAFNNPYAAVTAGSAVQAGTVTFQSGGFTITWAKTGSPTGTVSLMWDAI